MIEATATLKTVEGDVVSLPLSKDDGRQFWEVRMTTSCMTNTGQCSSSPSSITTLHVRRETLERAGLLPAINIAPEKPTETPEQLAIRLLGMLGVKFEE